MITGAASGLGRAIALGPLRPQLLLIDRDASELATVAAKIPHARTLTTNLADEAVAADILRAMTTTRTTLMSRGCCQ